MSSFNEQFCINGERPLSSVILRDKCAKHSIEHGQMFNMKTYLGNNIEFWDGELKIRDVTFKLNKLTDVFICPDTSEMLLYFDKPYWRERVGGPVGCFSIPINANMFVTISAKENDHVFKYENSGLIDICIVSC